MAKSDALQDRALARVGSVLRGKWRLDSVLGVGGMASVYAATHRNQARVAIKLMHPEISLEPEVIERFVREGYVANALDHGTARVLDDDKSEDGSPFLVMELLEGETVEMRWERMGRQLPLAEVLSIADRVLDVLAAAHDKGIVHRDLKPENLFLTTAGELKLLDFGIARMRELPQESHTRTKLGHLLGTPAYMAPEQARGRWDDIDPRTDLWALGATLFALIAGRYVHLGGTLQEQLILAGSVRAASLATVAPDVPAPVVEFIDRALAFEKDARWQDARSMRQALRALLGDEIAPLPVPVVAEGQAPVRASAPISVTELVETTARPVTQPLPEESESIPPARARRTGALFVVCGAVVGVALGAIVWARSTPSDPPAPAAPAASAQVEAPPAPEPSATPPEASAETAPAASGSAPAIPPGIRPIHPRTPRGAPTAKPSATATPAAPSSNPYDRRF